MQPGAAWWVILALTLGFFGPWAAIAEADDVVYSNLETYTGHTVSSVLPVWDDIQATGGGRLSSISFRVFNEDSGPPRGFTGVVQIADFNEQSDAPQGGGVPAVLAVDFSTASLSTGLSPVLTFDNLADLEIDLPADGHIGISLNFGSGQFGWALPAFDPVVIGSSTDNYWLGINPAPQPSPDFVANFAWGISVVPEPSSIALLLAGGLLCVRRMGCRRYCKTTPTR